MYLKELRLNVRTLIAACVGMAFGSAMNPYTMSLFAPDLLAEFGWSKADRALVGSIPLINVLLAPVAGWFVDRFGARMAATVGFTLLTLIGLAQGAEGDVGAYLVSRRLGVAHFSLLLSLLTSMIGGGSAIGALILSGTLRMTDSYNPFLLVAAGATIVGALLFGLTGARQFAGAQLSAGR